MLRACSLPERVTHFLSLNSIVDFKPKRSIKLTNKFNLILCWSALFIWTKFHALTFARWWLISERTTFTRRFKPKVQETSHQVFNQTTRTGFWYKRNQFPSVYSHSQKRLVKNGLRKNKGSPACVFLRPKKLRPPCKSIPLRSAVRTFLGPGGRRE